MQKGTLKVSACYVEGSRIHYKRIGQNITLPGDLRLRLPRCITYVKRKLKIEIVKKKVREKSRECHNHKPQPFPDPKRKGKPTNPNKHKSNKRTKSTKISSLFKSLRKVIFLPVIYLAADVTLEYFWLQIKLLALLMPLVMFELYV